MQEAPEVRRRRLLEVRRSRWLAPEAQLEDVESEVPEAQGLERSQAPEVRRRWLLEECRLVRGMLVGEFSYGLQQVQVAPLLLPEAQGLGCWDHSSSSRRWRRGPRLCR